MKSERCSDEICPFHPTKSDFIPAGDFIIEDDFTRPKDGFNGKGACFRKCLFMVEANLHRFSTQLLVKCSITPTIHGFVSLRKK